MDQLLSRLKKENQKSAVEEASGKKAEFTLIKANDYSFACQLHGSLFTAEEIKRLDLKCSFTSMTINYARVWLTASVMKMR